MSQTQCSWAVLVVFLFGFISCARSGEDADSAVTERVQEGPAWAKNAVIYEVNTRQYTPEGTFAAFSRHLPRLQEMGVDILWFMPVQPVSQVNKKGGLGSYYAVTDHISVNPEFGDLEEFKGLVRRIHEMGMRVMLDWVPGHTGRDHPWIEQHPDWYLRDASGRILNPAGIKKGSSFGLDDVAQLNYENPHLRQAMIDAMKFWVEEVAIDGFRCELALEVPVTFWEECIPALRSVNRSLLMLAEAEEPALRNPRLFDISYGWSFYRLMHAIARGEENADAIDEWLAENQERFRYGYHLHFITNHDENAWNGTVRERLGPAAEAMTVLYFTLNGMPLIYSGQEAGLDRSLRYYDKDTIRWSDLSKQYMFANLVYLKNQNQALWNGLYGGPASKIETGNEKVYAFYRRKNGDKVIVVLNLSGDYQEVVLDSEACEGEYTNLFANSTVTVTKQTMLRLNPWDYLIWSNE